MSAADLSVIILNWNTRADLQNALQSIYSLTHHRSIQVIVADNASEDGSREMVTTQFPQVELVANPGNLGFGAGNNRAIPFTTGRYVMFLNSDTILTEGAFDALVDYGDGHPEAGIIAPKLLNGDGTLQYSCRTYPNLGTGFFRNTPLGRLFPKNRFTQDYLMSDWDHSEPRSVDWVSGAALVIRRDMLEATAGFDEGFFMYCEDVDLCYRVHELGKEVVYCPAGVIYHLIGRSSDQVPARMTYEFHRSMYRFYRKHFARHTSVFVRPFILPGLVARALGRVVQYKVRGIRKRWSQSHRGADA